jgi:hypothetical protein
MNLPDITLLFQIIHFGIAYYILKRLVFVPAYNLLERQAIAEQLVQDKVKAAKKLYDDLSEKRISQFLFIQKSLTGMLPTLSHKQKFTCAVVESDKAEREPLTEQQKAAMVDAIKKSVIKV